jgi:uncharacterized RDD family membrane protein YckC
MTQPPGPPGFGPVPRPPHRQSVPPPPPPAVPVPEAGTWRRIAARAVDVALLLLVFSLLATVTVQGIGNRFADVVPSRVFGAIAEVLLSGGDVGAAAEDLGDSAWRMVVSRIQASILILIGVHLAYEVAANLWQGRTVGRMVFDLRLGGRDRPRVGVGQALVRALATVVCAGGLYGLAWIALLHGGFAGGFALWSLSVGAVVAYALPALVGRGRRSLGDLVAGTRTVPAGVYAAAGRAVAHAAQAGTSAAHAAAEAARRGAAQRAQQIPMQQMRETGGRWVSSAVESEQGRRLRRLGASAKERAEEAYRNRRGGGDPPESGER